MTFSSRIAVLAAVLLGVAHPRSARPQSVPVEIAELRQRVAAMRSTMTQTTAAAEYAANLFTRDTTARFLFSATRTPAMRAEFDWHTGASPEMKDADDPALRGIVILPVASWEMSGFTVAALLDHWQAMGRPVIMVGSAAGRPAMVQGRLVSNGAPDGNKANARINEVANLVATWVLYMEFVGAATRNGWHPGIEVSHLVPLADDSNYKIHFHGGRSTTPIAPGVLGARYLDRIDSILDLAALPAHEAMVQRAADSLRRVRSSGKSLFVGACAHYVNQAVYADSVASPFRGALMQYDAGARLAERGAKAGDGLLWFGYAGYDCPHVEAARSLAQAGLKVVVAAGNLPARFPPNVIGVIPFAATIPEHLADVPFNGEGLGSATSVEAMLHYIWMRRLLTSP